MGMGFFFLKLPMFCIISMNNTTFEAVKAHDTDDIAIFINSAILNMLTNPIMILHDICLPINTK